ncbi:MAG: hypothetical protein GY757_02175 [bacterium]|nr:hypothetical protein [bacterium]
MTKREKNYIFGVEPVKKFQCNKTKQTKKNVANVTERLNTIEAIKIILEDNHGAERSI